MSASKTELRDQSIFKSGEYLQYFRPEESGGPFTGLYREKLRDILSLVDGQNLHVLDVGGGRGRISIPLAESNRVLLSDISWNMLQKALSHRSSGLECVLADAQCLPFADGLFDYVLAIDLLVHLGDPERALSEFARVLRPQGRLIVDSTNGNPLWILFYPRYVGRNPVRWVQTMLRGGVLPEWQAIVRHYRKAQFLRMLAMAGFVVLRQRSYGPSICPKWNLVLAARAG